ncbi:3-methyl-2-oxobutanoate hydroxymethyltransferase [Arenicella xantha]|uniref:3-methyl-2-oxobutanoate hydroxymethyltransferase n=1 Tax=Arenicella xantha TaxID=644221 RepID=A0A395JGU0_9GAMM|nr:3-methyl-2-oxobutanoate hydroxymethyltransferase [Arenicella xantha]RBP49200.1 ketopantoate hydroxymethyltransferase [Arenicella xantha]
MAVTVTTMQKMKQAGDKITWLTAYDYSFASLIDNAGIDAILVGDSLGMVMQGHATPVPVTLEDAAYHTACVARGASNCMIVGDLPFGSYQVSKEQAYQSAVTLMQAGAHTIKLEGGELQVETIRFLVERGIAVCAHIGLTPQSVHQLGGFKVQGRGDAAQQLIDDAVKVEQAGAFAVVLEAVPAALAKQISERLSIPTIGIGAGVDCDGQVLVLQDMIGIYPKKSPKFCKNFMYGSASIEAAIERYIKEVKDRDFPALEHSFS